MSLSWPKVNENQLFTPAIILFTAFIIYQVSSLYFKESFFQYSYTLAIAGVVAYLKVFVITFENLSRGLDLKKWFQVTLNMLMAACQMLFINYGIVYLTQYAYPKVTIGLFLVSNIAFFVQVFTSKISQPIRLGVITLLLYSVLFGILRLLETYTPSSNEFFLQIQVFFCYIVLSIEILMMFMVTRNFVTTRKPMIH